MYLHLHSNIFCMKQEQECKMILSFVENREKTTANALILEVN